MIINANKMATMAYNQMSKSNALVQKSMERLSTGERINRASDDAAGLAISEKMRSQIRGLKQSERNAQDGISLTQLADSTLETTGDIVKRLHELAVQGATGTLEDKDRLEIGKEIHSLIEEIDNITQKTKFNGKGLFDGNGAFKITTGSNGENVGIYMDEISSATLGDTTNKLSSFKIGGTNAFETVASAEKLVEASKKALEMVSSERASVGAKQSRLEFSVSHIQTMTENITAAESRIRDVDTAKEMMFMTKNKMLAEVSATMLSQSMNMQQQVLQLIR